jgi:5-methyltetrahydropteroyltriglutamate--homocysteine methyltransferase
MNRTHVLGWPRIGRRRELKFALERHWRGEIDEAALAAVGRELRAAGWASQRAAGLDFVTVGDFSFYDHVADHIQLLGCTPRRFGFTGAETELARLFTMARGAQGCCGGAGGPALEMTKWFDTNYHYLVPEFRRDTPFRLDSERLFAEVAEAQALGHPVKVVLLGPLTFLWLGRETEAGFSRLSLLEALLPVYGEILARLSAQGVHWVELDEPILGLDLPEDWRASFEPAYHRLAAGPVRLLLATYFSPLRENLRLACQLPVAGLHVDAVRAPEELSRVLDWLPAHKVLSVGIVDGRNVWRLDPRRALACLAEVAARRGEWWLAPSCSLLHVPMRLAEEDGLDPVLRGALAFAEEKLDELARLRRHFRGEAVSWEETQAALARLEADPRRSLPKVGKRLATLGREAEERGLPFSERCALQQQRLNLPLLPTTTIGSFPQTDELRRLRAALRRKECSAADYERALDREVARVIAVQERLGLDVLVHGEPERTDMVEYFAQYLDGFALTTHGWVQSYGSRCVRPPIIFGDVARPQPITVARARHAQSLTRRPVKGMLTGPVTLLQWSFVREDQPRETTALQIAAALREEVTDLERAGIGVIQIDEPGFREGLPLRQSERPPYLAWAVRAFRIAAAGAAPETQIHTHMCYAEFEDILPAIAAMDADVITIETSRSQMKLLDAFVEFRYPNDIGPGVYDVHSPHVPSVEEIEAMIRKAMAVIPVECLWVNPDCGLKTRAWPETEAALANMVAAAAHLRRLARQDTAAV